MRDLRKAAIWLGLIGSVSLLPLSALGGRCRQPPARCICARSGRCSCGALVPRRRRPDALRRRAWPPTPIPATEPAPVAIEAADLKPAPAIDIPLPDAAPVTALMQADVFRMAVAGLFADDAAMREMRVSGKDREALSAYYAKAERPLIWARDGAWTPAASGAMERLKAADEDGLDPADYALPDRGLRKDAPPAQWARADVKLSLCRDPLRPRRPRGAHRSCPPLGARDPEAVDCRRSTRC